MEIPDDRTHGDVAANWALVLAKALRKPPRQIAEELVGAVPEDDWFREIEAAGPGFVNARLAPGAVAAALSAVEASGDAYGTRPPSGRRVLLEFISANPTGPLNVVSARAAAFGDALGNLLQSAGDEVWREYYVNDAGAQIAALGASLAARLGEMEGEPFVLPDNGYPGEYLKEIAVRYRAGHGTEILAAPRAERDDVLGRFALECLMEGVVKDLALYGIRFDRFFSERRDLREKGAVEAAIRDLDGRGMLKREDGALWLRTTEAGDDKDRVVVRSNGLPTYFAADIAYHRDKYERGFDTLIDVLGPDHHGYVDRMRAAVVALGRDPASFEVKLVQWMRLLRDGEAVSMSKRGGEFIPMADFLGEVGKDAARFFFLLRSADTPMDFDISLARSEANENPVFYVQYAHARISSILRQEGAGRGTGRPDLLTSPEEMALVRSILAFPEELVMAARLREPHHIARFALDLARDFHGFYNRHRVLGVEEDLSQARLRLVAAVGQVLRVALGILGVGAPESM